MAVSINSIKILAVMLYKMVLKKLIVANLVLITMGMWIHETYIKEFNQWFKRQSIVKNECDQHIVSENDLNKKQKNAQSHSCPDFG